MALGGRVWARRSLASEDMVRPQSETRGEGSLGQLTGRGGSGDNNTVQGEVCVTSVNVFANNLTSAVKYVNFFSSERG